jgi:hypothetical protein
VVVSLTRSAPRNLGPHSKVSETREVILRISVHHESMMGLYMFGLEVAPVCVLLFHCVFVCVRPCVCVYVCMYVCM